MPFAVHRGQRIHYKVEGSGPLVILQHGLLLDSRSWKHAGILQSFTDRYTVARVDSLGHCLSDKPSDPTLYDQKQRAGDLVAVIDDLGFERAHVIGHSMGGWMSVGVAKYYRERLSSLVVGGWDLVNGIPPGPKGPVDYASFMKFAAGVAPALVKWITPDVEPGVHACFDALAELKGAGPAVLAAGCPVLLWNGKYDVYHAPMWMFATANRLPFLSTSGDHLSMLFSHGAEAGKGLRAFLDGVPSGRA
jgi:pimeloyl-ACP methyl ester carboxylesterase